MSKRITVFGSSTPRRGEPAYQEAYDLGALLAGAGCTVLTGGYSGVMEAVSRGACEKGGHVIGVTCSAIEAWRPMPPNEWVAEEIRYLTLRERMYGLMDHCDMALSLPGGIGTLAEIAAMWSSLQTGELERPPQVLIGPGWREVFAVLRDRMGPYIKETNWDLIEFSPDIHDAYERVLRHLAL
ncbi:MAG TPA: LOG family protein [Anaerolineales bacterium]|nr:LOG family protein [Anaerolineales bacterium]